GGKSAALLALKDMAPDKVTPALCAAAQSKEPHVRQWAVGELAGRKLEPAAAEAVARELADKGQEVRKAAAVALGKLADRSKLVADALAARVADDVWYVSGYSNVPDDPEGGGKAAGLDALRALAPDRVKGALLAAGPKSVEVRAWALTELAKQKEN